MNGLTRYRRTEPLSSLRHEVDRLFGEFFPAFEEEESSSAVWAPRADLTETENAYMLTMDLPGMSKEDIQVNMRGNEVVISGERSEETTEEKQNYHRMERSYGRFYRSFRLPNAAKDQEPQASLKDGVLRIEVPKSQEKKARRIDIS